MKINLYSAFSLLAIGFIYSQDAIPVRNFNDETFEEKWARMDTDFKEDVNFNLLSSTQNISTGGMAVSNARGEHSFQINPAGLASNQKDFENFSASIFYSSLYSNLNLDDFYHTNLSVAHKLSNNYAKIMCGG